MAARTVGVWGIDLGQCALKAIRLEMKDGQPVATAFEYIEHPKILSQPDADPDELSREALNQFLSRNQIRGDIIAISVPGQSGLARFVKLPPVDEKKIADIVKFEAKQQIPFPLDEVVWDFQRLNKGDVIDGLALETEIGLFAMKRDMVTRAISQFKEVGVEVHLVQMAPLALCNFVSYDLLSKSVDNLAEENDDDVECIVALEIGTDSSNLVITNGGRIIWQRPIPIGGNHFTRALTKEMKLTFAKAEHLKKNAAKSPELKKILSSLKQVLNDFVGEVQRSLGYFTNTHRNAQILYMIGLGNAFRLPGLQKFLQEKLQLEVRKFKALDRTTGESVTSAPTFAENIMSFGVSYGLGLQGLKQARLQTNLLPYEVRLERVIRGKKPWVVAAAACLIVGMFMMAFAQGMEKKAVVNEIVNQLPKDSSSTINKVKGFREGFADGETKLKKTLERLENIGAGVNDRVNWQLLHQYVNMSTPQPNGDRLPIKPERKLVSPREQLWVRNDASQAAFRAFEEKRFGKLDAAAFKKILGDFKIKTTDDPEVFIKKNLIQVNIAGINALYSDDLGPYFRQIGRDVLDLEKAGMKDTEAANLKKFSDSNSKDPEEMKKLEIPREGWVVEIRGYTYHENIKELDFVEDTIVENLRNPTHIKDKEMTKRIKERVSHLLVYKNKPVAVPVTGRFEHISKSWLPDLLKVEPVVKVVPGVGDPPPPGNPVPPVVVAATPSGKSREGWKPIGERAASIFGGKEALDVPPPPPPVLLDEKARKAAQAMIVPRTEFVILFVWREPITAQQTIVLVEEKK